MGDINVWIGKGRLARDIDLKFTDSGVALAKFSLAILEIWYKENQKQTKTIFVAVEVWGKKAESCAKYLQTGSQVLVEGKLESNNYEDRNENKRTHWFIKAKDVHFISDGQNRSQE